MPKLDFQFLHSLRLRWNSAVATCPCPWFPKFAKININLILSFYHFMARPFINRLNISSYSFYIVQMLQQGYRVPRRPREWGSRALFIAVLFWIVGALFFATRLSMFKYAPTNSAHAPELSIREQKHAKLYVDSLPKYRLFLGLA